MVRSSGTLNIHSMHGPLTRAMSLPSWLLMRYPMPKSTRAKLVKFYYELCILPGVDNRSLISWSIMITRLCNNKPGKKRKLESSDLQLPWQPLWRVMQHDLCDGSG